MRKVRNIIRKVLGQSANPCLMWSGGKDSQLLLSIIREYEPDIEVILFRDELRPLQAEAIKDLNLVVFGYQPKDVYYLPNESGVSLVKEYDIAGTPFPIVLDVEHSDKCGLELSKERTPFFTFPWDYCFTGWKATDSHFIAGTNPYPMDGTVVGNTKFYAPLRHLSDEDVLRELDKRKLPFDADNDTLKVCTRCFSETTPTVFCPRLQTSVPTHSWNRGQALEGFRQRFLAVN